MRRDGRFGGGRRSGRESRKVTRASCRIHEDASDGWWSGGGIKRGKVKNEAGRDRGLRSEWVAVEFDVPYSDVMGGFYIPIIFLLSLKMTCTKKDEKEDKREKKEKEEEGEAERGYNYSARRERKD